MVILTVLPEGVSPEGVNSEGVNSEGINAEGVCPDGLNAEGVCPDGVNSEGVCPDGVNAEGGTENRALDKTHVPGPMTPSADHQKMSLPTGLPLTEVLEIEKGKKVSITQKKM